MLFASLVPLMPAQAEPHVPAVLHAPLHGEHPVALRHAYTAAEAQGPMYIDEGGYSVYEVEAIQQRRIAPGGEPQFLVRGPQPEP